MVKMNNTIVYRHRRLDTNQIFYVGIGNDKRPYDINNRSKFWKRIINKTDYRIEILAKNLSWEDACELECLLIKEYGRTNLKTGILCNLTDGGDGCVNLKHTLKSKKQMSKSHTGKKLTKESILKRSEKQYKQIIDLNSLIIYKNIDELLNIFSDLNKRKVQNQLSGITVNYSNFRYLNDYQNNILIKKENKRRRKILDTSTNIIYNSMLEVSDKFKIPLSTLNKYLKNIIKNKTTFIFLDHEKEESSDNN